MPQTETPYKKIKLESGDVVVVSWEVLGHLSGWIDKLFTLSRKLPRLGILSPLILDQADKIYWHGGYFAPNLDSPVSFAMGEKWYGQYPGTREVEVAPLVCAIISKGLVEKLGIPEDAGEDIFSDADYCLQAMAHGFKIYATDGLVVQYGGAAARGIEKKAFVQKMASSGEAFRGRWGPIFRKSFRLPVCFHTETGTPSGFASAARGYIRGLTELGIKIYYDNLRGVYEQEELCEDELINAVRMERGIMSVPQIVWGQPPFFFKNSGAYKIGFAEFEGLRLPAGWADQCNSMDEVWVPTEWNRELFRRGGVNVPLYIVQQGIDPNYFHPKRHPMVMDAKEPFRFITNAAWYPRKNLRNLILAFQQEFSKDDGVCLIVKTINLGLNKGIEQEVKEVPSLAGRANVYVREEETPFYQLGSFYTAGDCFVLPTRGEAWGLILFEALACGLPIITTGYGAPFEVLRTLDGKPLPGVHFIDWTEAMADEPYVYMEGNRWAEPSLPHLQKLMREVFNNREAEKAAALETSEIIRKNFAWREVMKPVVERLEDIYKTKMK
jgi:glycosyltransferase involved in cell wall biosynthesis